MRKIILLLFIAALLSSSFSAEAQDKNMLRLGMIKFTTKAKGVTEEQAAAIGDIFARTLANSKSLMIVERERIEEIANEHHLTKAGRFEDDDVIELGKLITCKYMLLGAVTNLEKKTSTTDFWLLSETHQDVSATIDIRIVDVETSKVIMTFSESGSSSRKGDGFNFYGIKIDKGKQFEGLEESAIAEAVFRLSFNIREELAGEHIQVINNTRKELTLNAGENWGIGPGVLFNIYSEGEEVKNLDGSSMGRKLTLVAVVKVTDAQKDFCYAEVMKDGGNYSSIHKGYKAQPTTLKEANKFIQENRAAKKNRKKKS